MKQTAALILGIFGLGAIFVQMNEIINFIFHKAIEQFLLIPKFHIIGSSNF
jgi:hypothetical protein